MIAAPSSSTLTQKEDGLEPTEGTENNAEKTEGTENINNEEAEEDPELERIRQLEEDFNDGEAFDLAEYKMLFHQAAFMGYPKSLVIEALKVLDDTDIVRITEYLFTDEKEKKEMYERRTNDCRENFRYSHDDLISEIQRLQKEIYQEQQKQQSLHEETIEKQKGSNLEFYIEFLRALICDEVMTMEHLNELKEYQKQKNISSEAHNSTLAKLNVSEEEWSAHVKSAEGTTNTGGKRGDFVVFNCMHAITASQARSVSGESGGSCPICGQKYHKIEKIFL